MVPLLSTLPPVPVSKVVSPPEPMLPLLMITGAVIK